VTLFLELIQLCHYVRVVLVEAASIDDDINMIALISNNSVVNNTAVLVGNNGQCCSSDRKVDNIRNGQAFNELIAILASNPNI